MVAGLPDQRFGLGLGRVCVVSLQETHAVPQIGHQWAQAGILGAEPIILLTKSLDLDG